MLYFSEVTNKSYKTANECIAAEEAYLNEKAKKDEQARIEACKRKEAEEKRSSERKAAAEKVETARKAMQQAQKNYRDSIKDFVSRFGTYHYSTHSADDLPTLFDFFSFW